MKALLPLLFSCMAAAQTPIIREAPVEWTLDARYHESHLTVLPPAKDCSYWGAAQVGHHCERFLIFTNFPQNLKCKPEGLHSDILRCVWDVPKVKP